MTLEHRTDPESFFASLKDRFRSGEAADAEFSVGYRIAGDGGGDWKVTVGEGGLNVEKDPAGFDDCHVIVHTDLNGFSGAVRGGAGDRGTFPPPSIRIETVRLPGSGGAVGIEPDLTPSVALRLFDRRRPAGGNRPEELVSLKVMNAIDQRFATGPVMGRWFAGLKDRKFLANKCPECGRTQIPPREICAVCRVRAEEFVELGPKGTITAWDLVYYASPDPLTGAIRETPYAVVYVMLDGASEQEAFSLELKKSDIGNMKIGGRVRPVWAEKTKGSYEDILYFELDD